MTASSTTALRSDARVANVQADRLRSAGDSDGARHMDRWAAILNARANGVTDPEQLRNAARKVA